MKIIDEYRKVIEDTAVVKSKLITAQRELHKNVMIYKPSDAKGIDYSREPVQTSVCQQHILITVNNICKLNNSIKELKKELNELEKQRYELENTIDELGDIKKKIILLLIKGYPQWKIAKELNYSTRHIRRIIKSMSLKCPLSKC